MAQQHFIDDKSVPASKSEIDLFSLPPTQVAIENGFWLEVNPRNTLTRAGPFEFNLTPDPYYVDLNSNYLYLVISVVKTDGSVISPPMVATDRYTIAPINLIGATFFRTVKLYLNNKLVFDSGDTYHYRAYMETVLNYSDGAKRSLLQARGYYGDTGGQMDTNNDGFVKRGKMITDGRQVELMTPLHIDLAMQERLLLNHIDIRLELHRNTDSLLMQRIGAGAATTFKVNVHSMSWFVRRVDVLKTLALGLEAQLAREAALYPIRHVMIRTIHIDQGRRETNAIPILGGQIPRRIIVTLVGANAYHGVVTHNPFNFKHYNVTRMVVTAGGVDFPRNPMTFDFSNKRYTKAYVNLF
ncbi:MAG: hypothetical protein GY751_25010, partial [Bacteroidetes bacterium]|nr:hypothetical protein [Bacteroidota bacterium]